MIFISISCVLGASSIWAARGCLDSHYRGDESFAKERLPRLSLLALTCFLLYCIWHCGLACCVPVLCVRVYRACNSFRAASPTRISIANGPGTLRPCLTHRETVIASHLHTHARAQPKASSCFHSHAVPRFRKHKKGPYGHCTRSSDRRRWLRWQPHRPNTFY